MIVAREFGWAAVSDSPMDWETFGLARLLLAEERAGRRVRMAQALEDAAFESGRDD